MGLTYFKRYRMEIDLRARCGPPIEVPEGYLLIPWRKSLLDFHAEVKFRSFRDELDANVFPCLGELAGCRRLMRQISRKGGFLERTTWLAAVGDFNAQSREYCGTIQGIRDHMGIGAIQNLGIVPAHRDRGLGACLMDRALDGFWDSGVRHVYLEVTAENEKAIRLYQRLGFQTVKTVFKVAEVAYT